MRAKVAIVIVNYHCATLVRRCLASLREHLRKDFLPIVVDNSTEHATGTLQRECPDAILLPSGANLGFAGGCNLGIRYALDRDIPYILLLNPDTRAEQDFLAPLVDIMEQHPAFGLLGPKIQEDTPARKLWNGGGVLNWWKGGTRRIVPDPPAGIAVQSVEYLSGCALLLRASAVRAAGFLDERYFLYFEDADYVQQMLAHGWKAGYVHGSVLLHAPSSTTGHQSRDYIYYFARNRIWFMKRWAPRPAYPVFLLYTFCVKMPGALLVFGLLRGQPSLTLAFYHGTLDGFRAGAFPPIRALKPPAAQK